MTTLQLCKSEEDIRSMIQESEERPVLLLKHSTACPISAAAKREFDQFAAGIADVSVWMIYILDYRSISTKIAQFTGITHQSPQIILLVKGRAVWHASHYSINAAAMQQAVETNREST